MPNPPIDCKCHCHAEALMPNGVKCKCIKNCEHCNPPKPNEGVKCLHEHLEKSQDSMICGIYCVDCGDFQSTDTIVDLLWEMVENQQQHIAELEERLDHIADVGKKVIEYLETEGLDEHQLKIGVRKIIIPNP